MNSDLEVTRMDLISRLIKELGSDSEVVRIEAGKMLLQMGTAAVCPLIEALNDPTHPARHLVAATLGQIGDRRAVEPLIQALKDPDKQVRFHAALALGKLKDPRALRPLVHALFDEMPPIGSDPLTGDPLIVRAAAAQALGELRAKESVPALKVLLKDEPRSLRRAVVQALGQIGTEEALNALQEAVWTEPDEGVANLIVYWLARHPSPQVYSTLERIAAEHPKEGVRLAARKHLQQIPEPVTSAASPEFASTPAKRHRHFLGWVLGLLVALLLLGALRWSWRQNRLGTVFSVFTLAATVLYFWHHRRRACIQQPPDAPSSLQTSASAQRERVDS